MESKRKVVLWLYDARYHILPLAVFPEMNASVCLPFKADFFYF